MGKITVGPKNWADNDKELLSAKWYIMFYFYDDNRKVRKKMTIENFNTIEKLPERQRALKNELKDIEENYVKYGWNPILKGYSVSLPPSHSDKPGPYMPFIKALKFALSKLKKSESTMRDLKTYINYIEIAGKDFGLNERPFCEVKKKNLKILFEKCALLKKGGFSPDKYNRLRTYIGIIYSELMEYEIAEVNIPLSLKTKKDAIKKVRPELTAEQRTKIDEYLKKHFYRMWIYMQCFFHSPPRTTEMFLLKVKDVNFERQEIKFLVKKGGSYREVIRVMPDIAVKYWRIAVTDKKGNPAPKDYYIFSRLRLPGPEPVKSYQNHKSWRRHIKIGLGIDVDFYLLKHTKVTEISGELGSKKAAQQAGESEAMINKIYDLDSKKRKDDDLKKAGTEFAPAQAITPPAS